MLVITRRINQSVIIDGCIEVVVTGITKEGVRLGINAPKEVEIHRSELIETIAEANRQATVKSSRKTASALMLGRLAKSKPIK
jgi:carbon storage regulator